MLDLTKKKAFAYEKFNVTHLFEYALIGHKTLWKTSKMFIKVFLPKFIKPFPKQALGLQYKSFENTVGKGEIARNKQFLLVTSNFSFSHSVFYLFEELSAIFVKFEIVICKPFQFEKV